jgi:hypothetical protein
MKGITYVHAFICCAFLATLQGGGDNPPCNTLFVGNLSDKVDEAELTSVFSISPVGLRVSTEPASLLLLDPKLFLIICGSQWERSGWGLNGADHVHGPGCRLHRQIEDQGSRLISQATGTRWFHFHDRG